MTRVFHLSEAGVPVVLSLHCTYPKESSRPELDPYLMRALRGVSAAYAVSAPVRDSFLANFARYAEHFKIEVIDNGVDTSRFAPSPKRRMALREELGIPEDAFVVIFCGRLDEFKNPLFALDIAHDVCRERDGLFFVFLGDGPLLTKMIHRISDSSMQHHVRLLGFVDDVSRYLQAADLYLSTSTSAEGFGLAPAEALACGVSILVPDDASFRYAFGACSECRFVKGKDPLQWSRELIRIVDSMRLNDQKIRSAAREFALGHLGETAMDERLVEFYKRWGG